MVIARLEVLLQDAALAASAPSELVEGIEVRSETFFAAGPASDRVVVVDHDPVTGQETRPLPFVGPSPGKVIGHFVAGRVTDDDDRFVDWLRANAYGLVMRTIELFEYDDVLARRIHWSFDEKRLTVRPRADRSANARYRRDTASLDFGVFASKINPGQRIYTALSRDIVAHETAHAVIDSVAPDLADGNPQSLALHEALADLTALHMALRSEPLRTAVLRDNDYRLEGSTAFNSIGEEMGAGRGSDGSLRNLSHDLTLSDVDNNSSHSLSQVLSGALWAILVKGYESDTANVAADAPDRDEQCGRALAIGAKRFRRITLRALDYLPAGEATLTDYARAVIASDRGAHPDRNRERRWLRQQLIDRGVITSADQLESEHLPMDPVSDGPALLDAEGASQFFAERRSALGIPPGAELEVRASRQVERAIFPSSGHRTRSEIIMSCVWFELQTGLAIPGLPPVLEFRVGCTVVVDAASGAIVSALTSSEARALGDARAAMADRALRAGQLSVSWADDRQPGRSERPTAQVNQGVVRFVGQGAGLHLMSGK